VSNNLNLFFISDLIFNQIFKKANISGIYIKIVLREIITYMNDPSLFQQIKIYVKVVKITLNDWKKNEQT